MKQIPRNEHEVKILVTTEKLTIFCHGITLMLIPVTSELVGSVETLSFP